MINDVDDVASIIQAASRCHVLGSSVPGSLPVGEVHDGADRQARDDFDVVGLERLLLGHEHRGAGAGGAGGRRVRAGGAQGVTGGAPLNT